MATKAKRERRKPRPGKDASASKTPERKSIGADSKRAGDAGGPKGAVEREKFELDRTLYFFRNLEAVASKAGDDAGDEIRRLAHEQAESARPLRVRLVRDLLGVSDHTIAAWCDLGILDERGESPRRVSLLSVLRAKETIDLLRSVGQDRNLTSALMNRLELEELGEDGRFRDSLAQASRGERGEWPEGF